MIIKEKKTSSDGKTVKFSLLTYDGFIIESSFFILENNKKNVCISSQIGCPSKCKICESGNIPFYRNLEKNEMINQVEIVAKEMDFSLEDLEVSFMGIGEPILNIKNVIEAINVFDKIGIKRVNISTIMPNVLNYDDIKHLDIKIHLQYSLHSSEEKKRTEIIGIQTFSIIESLNHLFFIVEKINDCLCINYTLLNDFNDTEKDLNKLVILLSKYNKSNFYFKISEYAPINNSVFKPSYNDKIFLDELQKCGYTAKLFRSSGYDVKASCGNFITNLI